MIDSRRRYSSVGEAFEVWKNYLVSMGYGYKLGIDLPGENRGFCRIASIMINITVNVGVPVPSSLLRSDRVKCWLRHCRFVIWRQPSLTGDILLLRMS